MKETLREKLKRVVARLNNDIQELNESVKKYSFYEDFGNASICQAKAKALISVRNNLQDIILDDE